MTLRFEDKSIGGFWLTQDGPYFHLYYQQIPRSRNVLDKPSSQVSIGHAVSEDLIKWEILPDALHPSDVEGSWDNTSIGPGSIIGHGGLWYLFYTGKGRQDNELVERIGLALSDDLINWQKYMGNPVIKANPQWYETSGMVQWADPWLFRFDGYFHAYIVGRQHSDYESGSGAIAHARSKDLLNWKVLEPVAHPELSGKIQSPQLERIGSRWYLFYNVEIDSSGDSPSEITESGSGSGLYYLVGETPLGPFSVPAGQTQTGEELVGKSSHRVIQDSSGQWVVLGLNRTLEKGTCSELGDPILLKQIDSGQLRTL